MFVRAYRYSYDFGVVFGAGETFFRQGNPTPLSSQELTHKMLCRQSQLSAQPYRTVTENIGIIFLFCAHISNFLLFRNKCNFRHRGIGLYIRPIWAYIRYINTPNPITFYSKILRSIGLPVVVHTCFASLSAGLYVKKPACLSL